MEKSETIDQRLSLQAI